jgi:hypothetical protein
MGGKTSECRTASLSVVCLLVICCMAGGTIQPRRMVHHQIPIPNTQVILALCSSHRGIYPINMKVCLNLNFVAEM